MGDVATHPASGQRSRHVSSAHRRRLNRRCRPPRRMDGQLARPADCGVPRPRHASSGNAAIDGRPAFRCSRSIAAEIDLACGLPDIAGGILSSVNSLPVAGEGRGGTRFTWYAADSDSLAKRVPAKIGEDPAAEGQAEDPINPARPPNGVSSARSRVNMTATNPPITMPATDIAFAIGPAPCVPASV